MHLNDAQLIDQRQSHVEAFLAVGGKWMIIVGTDQQSNEQAIDLVEKINQHYSNALYCKATVGIHPAEVSYGNITSSEAIQQAIAQVEELYLSHQEHIVAFGECWLDAHYPDYTAHQALQEELFVAHIVLAQKYTLPLVVHSRDDFVTTLAIMRQAPLLKRYLHCRSYSPEELKQLDAFPQIRVGRCGNTTYPKAMQLRESFLACQSTHIQWLLETDAPYLSPQGKRGEINTSANIPQLYRYMSTYLERDEKIIQSEVESHFKALFVTNSS